MRKYLALAALIGLAIGACSKVDDMHRMTGELKDSTGRMDTKMSDLGDRVGGLRDDQAKGTAAQVRSLEWSTLIDPQSPLEKKFASAATYIQSLEFQVWRNGHPGSLERRERLMAESIEEFLLAVRAATGDKREDPDPASGSNSMRVLLALGATLDQVSLIQKEEIAHNAGKIEEVSVLSMLEQGLLAKAEKAKDPSLALPDWKRKVLFFDDEAVYMLQLRMNILAGVVLDKLVDPKGKTIMERLKVLAAAVKLKKGWEVNPADFNSVELEEMNRFTMGSQRAKDFLLKLNVEPLMDKKVDRLLKTVKFKEATGLDRASNDAYVALQASLEKLASENQ